MQHVLSQEIRTWGSVIQSTLESENNQTIRSLYNLFFYKHNSLVFINKETQSRGVETKRARETIIETRLLDLILR